MIRQKNTNSTISTLQQFSISIKPDETLYSNGLFFKNLTIDGYEYGSQKDFVQPTVKSYKKTCTSGGVYTSIFKKGDDVPNIDFTDIYGISIILTDATGNTLTTPTDLIKIYVNTMDTSDFTDTELPFMYVMSSSFEFMNVEQQLHNIYIYNNYISDIIAQVNVARNNDTDSNAGIRIEK